MKTTLTCPKCQGRRIWQVERLCSLDQGAYARPLRLASRRKRAGQARSGWQKFMQGSADVYDAGYLDAWVCGQCGYTELYSREFDQLEHNPEDGIRLHGPDAPK